MRRPTALSRRKKYWIGGDGGMEDARRFGSRFLVCEALRDESNPRMRKRRPSLTVWLRQRPYRIIGVATSVAGRRPRSRPASCLIRCEVSGSSISPIADSGHADLLAQSRAGDPPPFSLELHQAAQRHQAQHIFKAQ
ncbi:hypothetical protein V6N12_047275 [Hibiscus sabdariffa]|uniref:Uncharacterized protein n=1 Tax=Hibiscus sabdariffa TaxID=183260 RepID=A0ABR2DAE6_9ROSI